LLRGAFPGGAVHTSLLKAIPDVVSGEPVLELWKLSRLVRENDALRDVMETASSVDTLVLVRSDPRFVQFRDAFQSYLDAWGFRCSEELMLTSPSFQENPAPLVEMIRAYARLDGESPPSDAIRAQTAERERETRRVESELSAVRAALLKVLLPRTHSAIRYRERARLKQALLYSRCRRVALAMGDALVTQGTIAERDEVFFLTWQELDELIGGGAMFPHAVRDVIAARRREHVRLSATTPPDSFTLAEGEYLDDERVPADDCLPPTGGRLAGTPACGGQVTGRAAVLRDVTEAAQLERGDVLVTKQTDPGWAPAFFLISGLVIERGGMLSHGAIIAREFGIPCVVGVKNAMARIPSGATIAVNGDTGCVHVDL
jgi:rifampicin phosphotransferase